MSFENALRARDEFRQRQRQCREQGTFRRKTIERRDDDEKPDKNVVKAEADGPPPPVADDDKPDDKSDDEPAGDESSTKSFKTQTLTSLSSKTASTNSIQSPTCISNTIAAASTPSAGAQSSAALPTSIPTPTIPSISHSTIPATTQSLSSSIQNKPATTPVAIPVSIISSTLASTHPSKETSGFGISSSNLQDDRAHQAHHKSEHTSLIVLSVLGTIAGMLLLFATGCYYHRRRRNPKTKLSHNEREADAYNAPDIWGAGAEGSTVGRSSRATMMEEPTFSLPPPVPVFRGGGLSGVGAGGAEDENQSTLGNYAGDRQGRLARVRTSILGEREMKLGQGMGRGHGNGAGSFGRGMGSQRLVDDAEEMGVGGRVDLEPPVMKSHMSVDSSISAGATGARETWVTDAGETRAMETMEDLEMRRGTREIEAMEEELRNWELDERPGIRGSVTETVVSVPTYRDPVTWAADQARRNGSGLRYENV